MGLTQSRFSVLGIVCLLSLTAESSQARSMLVLFEQPETTNLSEHFFIPTAGPPPHRQGPDELFSLYLWQPNPYREDGKLVPASWRAGDKTGFYPRDAVHNQLGFQDVSGTTTVQAEGGVVGAYLNPSDETPDTDFGKLMITPVIRWPESKALRPFTNADNAIEVDMDLQVPTASSASRAGSIAYVVADLEFLDQTSRMKISYGCALFFHKHDGLKSYPVGYDAPSNSVVANVPVIRDNPRITVLPGSAVYTGTTWRGWRNYRFVITAQNFGATLAAIRAKSPASKPSDNLADYKLTMYHLNAEINHSSAPAELGWSLRNTRIGLHDAGNGRTGRADDFAKSGAIHHPAFPVSIASGLAHRQ
jgi:hypothetical protein